MTRLIIGVQRKQAENGKEKVERGLDAPTRKKLVKVMVTAKQPATPNPSMRAKARRKRAKESSN
jgi:hypothetical protein